MNCVVSDRFTPKEDKLSTFAGLPFQISRDGEVVSHLAHNQEITGAIPVPATNKFSGDILKALQSYLGSVNKK